MRVQTKELLNVIADSDRYVGRHRNSTGEPRIQTVERRITR